jgi:hypothetical protein
MGGAYTPVCYKVAHYKLEELIERCVQSLGHVKFDKAFSDGGIVLLVTFFLGQWTDKRCRLQTRKAIGCLSCIWFSHSCRLDRESELTVVPKAELTKS